MENPLQPLKKYNTDRKPSKKKWPGLRIIVFAFIILDLAVYMSLGVLIMRYGNACSPGDNAYRGWQMMSTAEKIIHTALVFWHFVNAAAVTFVLYRAMMTAKKRHRRFR